MDFYFSAVSLTYRSDWLITPAHDEHDQIFKSDF